MNLILVCGATVVFAYLIFKLAVSIQTLSYAILCLVDAKQDSDSVHPKGLHLVGKEGA
jgi:hypothetical protein